MKTIDELKAMIQAGKDAERELEERGRVKFREGEWIKGPFGACQYNPSDEDRDWDRYTKFTLEDIVGMMAPPEAVRWEMGDRCDVFFFNENGTLVDGMSFPNHMARDDWQSCGGEL